MQMNSIFSFQRLIYYDRLRSDFQKMSTVKKEEFKFPVGLRCYQSYFDYHLIKIVMRTQKK